MCGGHAGGGASHQRFRLLADLAADPDRNLILVTATPHSGNEGAFRSLVGLLDPSFAGLADDRRPDRRRARARLARHFVQRRRADIRSYLDADTPFPDRLDLPEEDGRYKLSAAYRDFVDDVLACGRPSPTRAAAGTANGCGGGASWPSLRPLASSPAAAAATLRNRAAPAGDHHRGGSRRRWPAQRARPGRRRRRRPTRRNPGRRPRPRRGARQRERRRLRALADRADQLAGGADAKLAHATRLVRQLLAEGYNPIVFCRFIPTADYLAGHLRAAVGKNVEVDHVTGMLPPDEREARVPSWARPPDESWWPPTASRKASTSKSTSTPSSTTTCAGTRPASSNGRAG